MHTVTCSCGYTRVHVYWICMCMCVSIWSSLRRVLIDSQLLLNSSWANLPFVYDTIHTMHRRSAWRFNHCLTLYFGCWLYAAVSPTFEYDMSRSHSRTNRRSNHINANPPEYRINLESPSLTISQTISITSPKPSASPLSVSPTGIAFSRNYSLGHLRSLFLTFHPHF